MAFFQSDGKNGSRFIGRDANTNRMLTGGTQTIVLRGGTSGERNFEAGIVFQNEVQPVVCTSTEGIKYNTSNDYYEVLLGKPGEVKLVNMYGEVITASGSEYLLKGTKVTLSSNEFPRFNGTYTLHSCNISGVYIKLNLVPDGPNFVFGDSDMSAELDNLTGVANTNKVQCTVLPFAPAFAVEMLGVDGVDAGTDDARTTPVKFRMNNVAGTNIQPIDYPDGQVVYGEITHFTPQAVNTHYAILYCQDKPSLDFSPYRTLPETKIAASVKKTNPLPR